MWLVDQSPSQIRSAGGLKVSLTSIYYIYATIIYHHPFTTSCSIQRAGLVVMSLLFYFTQNLILLLFYSYILRLFQPAYSERIQPLYAYRLPSPRHYYYLTLIELRSYAEILIKLSTKQALSQHKLAQSSSVHHPSYEPLGSFSCAYWHWIGLQPAISILQELSTASSLYAKQGYVLKGFMPSFTSALCSYNVRHSLIIQKLS